jgi:hypothetical protein
MVMNVFSHEIEIRYRCQVESAGCRAAPYGNPVPPMPWRDHRFKAATRLALERISGKARYNGKARPPGSIR